MNTEQERPIRHTKMRDQHDRLYGVTIDTRTGTPIGMGPKPLGWKAPWMLSQEWARYDRDDPMRFTWDYEGALNDRIAAHELYDQQYEDFCTKRGWDPTDESKKGQVTSVIGVRPQPIELIVAAMQGNKYILGQTTVVDERVVPFLKMRPKYQRQAKKEARLASLPDFSDPPDGVDEYGDLEEQVDKRPTRLPKARKPKKEVVA
ncbi:MAG TPA: hypothetical protein VMZ71_13010 [Gemmataceae bacterium]|nr:hypothetical protein [Gemmataceae bacterium]